MAKKYPSHRAYRDPDGHISDAGLYLEALTKSALVDLAFDHLGVDEDVIPLEAVKDWVDPRLAARGDRRPSIRRSQRWRQAERAKARLQRLLLGQTDEARKNGLETERAGGQ